MHRRICIGLLNAIFLAGSCVPPAPAANPDWGYEGTTQAQQDVLPMRAHAQPLGKPAPDTVPDNQPAPAGGVKSPFARTAPAGTAAAAGAGKALPPSKPGAVKTAAAKTQATKASAAKMGTKYGADQSAATPALVEECWAQVYELAGKQKLDPQQREELSSLVQMQLKGTPAQQEQARSVVKFWPKLTDYLTAREAQRENYSALLRALLRFRSRNLAVAAQAPNADDAATNEFNLISEVLGPQRLTVPGAVPFSEEAVNAYADMACFIYELKNPGKTVDAVDNRAVFAAAVSEKFKSAPTKRDQQAMAAFDLSWAKFKIVWTQADDKQKEILKMALLGGGPGVALEQAHDAMLELVLHNWPGSAAKSSPVASSAGANPHK